MKTICFSCNKLFDCGIDDQQKACWCTSMPLVSINKNHESCLCECCLGKVAHADVRCFRLHISYRGQDFSGMQQQDNARTVEGELKSALKKITQKELKLSIAGRTDAGVHAQNQVVSLEFATKLKTQQLLLALASLLPKDMAVYRIDEMPTGFDARRHSIGRHYVYRIYQGLVADPFLGIQALHVRKDLNVEKMQEAASYFIGEHDFSSFRSSLCRAQHARRYLWRVDISKTDQVIEIDVRGNAFCQNQVRIMAGTLIEVGFLKRDPQSIKEALLRQDRTLAGITAKPHGLTLKRVYYPDDLNDALIPEGACFPRFPITTESWPF